MTATGPWHIQHIDLSGPLAPLLPNALHRRVVAYFWWQGVPLGVREYDAGELPRPAAAVAEDAMAAIAPSVFAHFFPGGATLPPLLRGASFARGAPPRLDALLAMEDPLAQLAPMLTIPDDGVPGRLSVIVCTHKRPEMLRLCLKALVAARDDCAEIIVVDNAPATGETKAVIEDFPAVTYVAEPTPGLSAARNAGIRASSGDLIAFTDDDVVIDRNWPKRVKLTFTQPHVAAMTGLVLPASLESDAQIAFEKGFGGFSGGFQALEFGEGFFGARKGRGVPAWRLGAGANMAFRREVFGKLGLFDERLGAGAAGCSEDSELWYRLLAAGLVCRYEPTAVVFHHHRADWDALRRQAYSYMRGHVAALLIQFRRHRHWGNIWRIAFDLPFYYAGVTVRHCFGRQEYWQFRLVRLQMLGCLAGIPAGLRPAPKRRGPA